MNINPSKVAVQESPIIPVAGEEITAKVCESKRAFLNFISIIDLGNAAAILDKASFKNRPFERDIRVSVMNFSPQTSVYIRNLPSNSNEDSLLKAFKVYGTVLGCQVKKEKDSTDRTFGFVNFKDAQEANEAIAKSSGKPLAHSDSN